MPLLSPYRVLDLTDHRGELAGAVMADLGAEVIRIEPPGGVPSRRRPPLDPAAPAALQSLEFIAWNRGKRSIVLDFARTADLEVLRALITDADFVIESGPPGRLAAAELDFTALAALNPRLVRVMLTPFGADGPRAHWRGSDLVLAALGGPLALQGTPDRPPVRLSVPQVWRHAGVEAVVAALIAHARLQRTGQAQDVDVSAQCVMTWTLLNAMDTAAIQGEDFRRRGSVLQIGGTPVPLVFEVADGHVVAILSGATVRAVLPEMIAAGLADESWYEEDWPTWRARVQFGEPVKFTTEQVRDAFTAWLRPWTRQALMRHGLEIGVSFAPANTLADVLAFDHLEARGFWQTVTLPGGKRIRAPGAFARTSSEALVARGRAPDLDEHGPALRAAPARRARPRLPAPDGAALPLAGLKVADFSWVGVGPITGRYLADHGATVVRIESEGRPDVLRGGAPMKDGVPGINRSQFYGDFNTSKLGLQLDLKQPAAVAIARRLIAWADVCIESFTPGTMARFGLGYESVRDINPGIVMLSTCLMGQTGPARALAGYGYHAGAVAGFLELTGWPDREPSNPWVAYTDTIAPRYTAALVLAALDRRRRTGEGLWIDAAQLEMGLQFLTPEILEHQVSGARITRMGNRSRHFAPQGVYPCRGDDRWCAIAIDNDAEWQSLCRVLGRDDWARDAALADAPGRLARHDELDQGIGAWTAEREAEDVAEILQAAGVPAGVPQLSRDLLEDPQYRHRGFYRWLEHPEMGRIPYAGHQFRIAGYPSGPRGPAPLLGQHLTEVLGGLLGMSDSEIADALANGALG